MTDAPRILVVEDDLRVVQSLIGGLRKEGFDVTVAMDGEAGLRHALDASFDVIILDLMLPERDGFGVLDALKGRVSTPVIVLSARTELPSRLASFANGAVDFVPKPFFMAELVARIRSRLDLRATAPHRERRFADIRLDLDTREVFRDRRPVVLTAHEFNVLAYLTERPGRPVTRAQLADHALPEAGERSDRTVDSYISRIRKKLGPTAARHIRTVWGIGYRFDQAGT